MVVDLSVLFDYLIQGQFQIFFIQLFNYYLPYGIFYMLVGVVLFSVLQIKTGNMGYSASITTIYFVYIFGTDFVVSGFALLWLKIFGIIIALGIISVYLYGLIKT